MSPQREFSRVLSSTASFLFSPVDFYRVSLRENHGFCLQWLYTLHFPRGFLQCLFEREPRILPSVALHFAFPQRLYTVSFLERTMDFAFSDFTFSFPHRIYIMSLRERITDFALNGLSFSFPQWIFTMSLQREFSWISPSVDSLYFHP